MKKSILLLIWVFIASFGMAQLPDIDVKDLDQNWVMLSDLQGDDYTVIDFWATWCKPCVSAIPKLNSIYQEFSGKGVEFIGVNVDGPRNQAKVKPFTKSLGVLYPIILDPNQELVDRYNVSAFPTLIVLNKKGEEVYVHEGFNAGDEIIIEAELEKLLKR